MPSSHRRFPADPAQIVPGDIVLLSSALLQPARGDQKHTWTHYGVCLFRYNKKNPILSDVIVSGTEIHFACISSITKAHPFDPKTQVKLDPENPNHEFTRPSAACVDFSPKAVVTVEGDRHVLIGVARLTDPFVWRVKFSPELQAILGLFRQYWRERAAQSP